MAYNVGIVVVIVKSNGFPELNASDNRVSARK